MRNNLSSVKTLLMFLLFLVMLKETRCSVRQLKLYEFQRKLLRKTSFKTSAAVSTSPKSSGRVFYPIGYGADPTGAHDSTAAIMGAINDAVKEVRNGGGLEYLLPGISDLDGVVIDFQGGNFLITNPIEFPSAIGNIVVQGGTLRASNKFPGNRHLMELGSPDSRKPSSNTNTGPTDNFSYMEDGHNNDGIKYEDITFRDILFDSSIRGGGLLIVDSARIRVVDCFFLHFTTQGIIVKRGHETFISNCFLGQHPTDGGDSAEKNYAGTGIDIASTDNAVTDVVVFSAETGIVLRGNANIVTGIHCYNKATPFGGVGILIRSAQNRIMSPYLDFNSIVIEDPSEVHVLNGFFLGDGNIVLKSIQGRISGLNIVNNIFSGLGNPKKMVPCVRLEGVFGSIDQVVIDRNVVNGMRLKSTVAKLAVAGNGKKWKADFAGILLFPDKINHVEYSFYLRKRSGIHRRGGLFPAHAVTKVSNNVVVIESHRAFNSVVVSVSVDQYNMIGEGTLYK